MDLLALTIQLSRRARCIQTAKTIIKRILADHLRPIYRYLSSHTRLPTPALRLLAAITHFSTAATRDLFVRFNFTLKALPVVMAQRKGGVRAWYLRFVMGFWKMGDATVKRGVLELKDFVGFMFNGLYADDKGVWIVWGESQK